VSGDGPKQYREADPEVRSVWRGIGSGDREGEQVDGRQEVDVHVAVE
jgi:hypothetical protein